MPKTSSRCYERQVRRTVDKEKKVLRKYRVGQSMYLSKSPVSDCSFPPQAAIINIIYGVFILSHFSLYEKPHYPPGQTYTFFAVNQPFTRFPVEATLPGISYKKLIF
ncbi:MAG: hypothetical protein HQM08_05990 [Candidatus Riflebacteria bacterium]|nr:hypothetical protein [Candidatus Riflebacteria bacterium]